MRIFLLFLLLSSGKFSSAQSNAHEGKQNIDSLLMVYDASPEDTLKAKLANRISNFYYAGNDMANATKFANYFLELSIKFNFLKGRAFAYNTLGNIYTQQANYPKALDYHFKALGIKEKLKDVTGTAGSNLNISNIYTALNNKDKAMEHILKALELFKKANVKKRNRFLPSKHRI